LIAGRALSAGECSFLATYFGDALDTTSIRLVASLGKRSWSPFGHRISIVKRHFCEEHPDSEVALTDPHAASVFAHEAMHVWQRQHGRRVTWEAIPLQAGYMLAGRDPYHYEPSDDPAQMLERFLTGNVEQQAKIVEDLVYRDRTGAPASAFAAVADHVRSAAPEGIASRGG
jgi:hypothetical protein